MIDETVFTRGKLLLYRIYVGKDDKLNGDSDGDGNSNIFVFILNLSVLTLVPEPVGPILFPLRASVVNLSFWPDHLFN